MTNKELRGRSANLSILDGSEWEYEGPDNIIYCYASMSDAQKDLLLEVVQRYDKSKPPITAGTLPFFSRAKCLEYVKRYIEDEFPAWMPEGIAHLQLKKMLDT